MKIKAISKYKVVTYNITNFLDTIKNGKIKIINLQKIDQYTYSFYSLKKYKKLLFSYSNVYLVKDYGLLNILFSFFKYKTTLLAMVISTLFYISLSNRIWLINITGDNQNLNSIIEEKLLEYNVYVGAKKKNIDDISYIQKEILYNNFNLIEYLSIDLDGCCINVNFKKKRNANNNIELRKSLYAKKDGVIKSFDILSGEKVVDVNDYVKEGDLLVKDIITTDYDKEVYVGTYGYVYAYTWYYVTIKEKVYESNKETIFANLLINIKSEITSNFSEYEYIYEENVLKFNIENNMVNMKVHFTCVEEITRE